MYTICACEAIAQLFEEGPEALRIRWEGDHAEPKTPERGLVGAEVDEKGVWNDFGKFLLAFILFCAANCGIGVFGVVLSTSSWEILGQRKLILTGDTG